MAPYLKAVMEFWISVSFWDIKHQSMYLTISTSALNDNILRVALLESMDGFDDDEWAEM